MHDNEVIHRDIKTLNIFLARDGTIKVGDFGISKSLKKDQLTRSLIGTPAYASPEVH
jgi:serine/threonine protein kinase